nr:ribonuclease H-like domain-containing protein [Tanacetum cinerariifolium]
TNGQIRVLPAKTTKEILAREKERKARTTLLIAIPEDHLVKFHKITDAKEMWEAIKSRFGGNDESKKMQKYLLKQQFKSFSVSNSEGLHKGYDRFQSLLSQLETHGADLEQVDEFDFEEMNLKWQVAMISTRLKKFYKKIKRKLHFDANEPVRFVKSKIECFNCHNTGHFARKCRSKGNKDSRMRDTKNTRYKARDNGKSPAKQDEHKAMVTIDGKGVDWTGHAKDDTENYALIAFNSSNSGSDTEKLKLLVEAEKEKEEFKTKLENFQSSSKGLSKLLNSQMSAKDKSGLGFSHLIKDCDFHEKRMAKQVELNKDKNTLTCQRNDRLVWNNVQRLNHKNKFIPTAVLTKTGRFPVNAARQNFSSQTTSTSIVRKVNTARPIVNEIRPRHNVYKSHAPNRRPFNRTTTPKANFIQHKINTAGDKVVSAVRGKWETVVKASAGDV